MARNALPGARRELHKISRRDLPYPTEKPGVCPYNKDTLPAFLFCGQRTDPQAFLKTVSGAVMTTRVLSATEPVRKALPPTTEWAPMAVLPPRMDAPE
jgi:hypothetical protein